MKPVYRFFALAVVIFHVFIIFLVLLGWAIPVLYYWHGIAVIGTVFSRIVIRRCILIDVEYYFKQKYASQQKPKVCSFTVSLLRRVFGEKSITNRFVVIWSDIFIIITFFAFSISLFTPLFISLFIQ